MSRFDNTTITKFKHIQSSSYDCYSSYYNCYKTYEYYSSYNRQELLHVQNSLLSCLKRDPNFTNIWETIFSFTVL